MTRPSSTLPVLWLDASLWVTAGAELAAACELEEAPEQPVAAAATSRTADK